MRVNSKVGNCLCVIFVAIFVGIFFANTYFYNGFGCPTKTLCSDVATATEETTHTHEKLQQSLEDATTETQKQCFFCDGTSRYGVPENLTTG